MNPFPKKAGFDSQAAGTAAFPRGLEAEGKGRENPGIPTIHGFNWMGFAWIQQSLVPIREVFWESNPTGLDQTGVTGPEFRLFPIPPKANSMENPPKSHPRILFGLGKNHRDKVLESPIPQGLEIRDKTNPNPGVPLQLLPFSPHEEFSMKNGNTRSQKFPNPSSRDDPIPDFWSPKSGSSHPFFHGKTQHPHSQPSAFPAFPLSSAKGCFRGWNVPPDEAREDFREVGNSFPKI